MAGGVELAGNEVENRKKTVALGGGDGSFKLVWSTLKWLNA